MERPALRRLLEAYRAAERYAAIEYDACLAMKYPKCLADNAARLAFRRLFKRLC